MLRADDSSDFVITRAIGLAEDIRRQVRVREGEGIAGRVASSRQPVMGCGTTERNGHSYRTDSFVSVPILVNDELRGVLNVADPVDGEPFQQADLATLQVLAAHIGACLVQQEQGDALAQLAETDALTMLFNRRHFDRRLDGETNRALRSEHLLAVLMIDVDRFKMINDRFGHAVGDHVLSGVGSAIKQAIRLYDVATRHGGDEFAVILPESDTESATRVARRILQRTAELSLPSEMVAAGERVQLSIGVATYPRPAVDIKTLVASADTAMYRAKQAGGGVRVWEHAFAEGPRGAMRSKAEETMPAAPYLADPSRLATADLQALIPRGLASEWNALVVGREGQVLTIAMPKPNLAAVDALSKVSGYAIYPVYSNATDLDATRKRLS